MDSLKASKIASTRVKLSRPWTLTIWIAVVVKLKARLVSQLAHSRPKRIRISGSLAPLKRQTPRRVRIHRARCQLANSRKIQKELQTFSNWQLPNQLTWLSPASRWAMILSLTKRLSQLSQSKILQLVSLKSLCTTSWHILAISISWEQRRKTRVAKIQTNDAKRATRALKVAAKTVSKRHKRCLKLSSKTLRWWLSYKLSFINSSTKLAIWPMLKLRSLSWNNPSKHINRVRPTAKILTQDHLPHFLKVASKLKILAQFLANKSSLKV